MVRHFEYYEYIEPGFTTHRWPHFSWLVAISINHLRYETAIVYLFHRYKSASSGYHSTIGIPQYSCLHVHFHFCNLNHTCHLPTTSAIPIPGNPNLPAKLVQKIISWEYVDLSELLPEQLNQFATPTTSTI